MHRSHYILALAFACGCRCGGMDVDDAPNCAACVADGDACSATIECNPGRICNRPEDELFEPNEPPLVCVEVACASDADCVAPKHCTLERLCRAPVCQGDEACANGEACVGGACVTARTLLPADRCVIVSPHATLVLGDSTPLSAIALRGGEVLPIASFTFVSSDPEVVAIDGTIATAGDRPGVAAIHATVDGAPGVMCGGLSIQTFEPIANGRVRIVAIDASDGAPLEGAAVFVAASAPLAGTTDAFGRFERTSTVAIDAITIAKSGWRTVSILEPGVTDVVVPVPRAPDLLNAGGIRGGVDLSKTPTADFKAALVYSARSLDLLEYRALPVVDLVRTRILVPEVSVDRTSDLPGNFVAGLDANEITRDTLRCRSGDEVGLGCFLTRAPAGRTAAWVMGGEYKLSAISSLANELSAFERPDTYTARDRAELIRLFTPLTQGGWLGALPYLEVEAHPKVKTISTADCSDPLVAISSRCQADFDEYVRVDTALSHRAAIASELRVPKLPPVPGGECAGALIAASYAVLPGRGLVLTGMGGGDDVTTGDGLQDCFVARTRAPFGDLSDELRPGSVPLTTTPLHSGMEGSDQVLVLTAIDTSERPVRPLDLTLIAEPIERYERLHDLSARRFLPFPEGALDVTRARLEVTNASERASGLRLAIESLGGGWIVYLPPSMSAVDLPDVPAARAALAGAAFTTLQAFEIDADYVSLWGIDSATRLDRVKSGVRAVTTTQCGDEGPCLVE